MIRKVLIANRGEIAVRIIRACKELGIKTVAIYSEVDKNAIHTELADEAICVGTSKSKDSYLNESNILSAAVITGCNAIHPGFGFLSENTSFAGMCEECNIKFIGPSKEIINIMGNKSMAREIMKNANIPIIPGSEGLIRNLEEAKSEAKKIGYPVMIKATAGGGGKGMRIARNDEELEMNIVAAQTEAGAAFGNPDVYIEKFVENPRHIEIQILGDKYGNVIYLGERDCSIQRRHQKLIEEAPSFSLPYEVRKAMGEAAVTLAKAINYDSAGTLEFLVDKDNKFYFMEMNTRVQVEHTVTEMVTGLDIIKLQIQIASGAKLNISQDDIQLFGHAIECRINAEDPENNFLPSPGVLTKYIVPGGNGVRVDSHSYQGYEISPYYDSMIGKLITFGINREEAIAKMKRALNEYIIEGIDTTIPFHLEVLNNELYLAGKTSTNFIEENFSKK